MRDFATQTKRPGRTTDVTAADSSVRRIIQRKLRVGATNDPAEHEADRVADQIVARIAAGAARSDTEAISAGPAVRRAPVGAATGAGGGPVDADVEQSIQRLSGSGSGLPTGIRRSMESAFDADFSQVRLHTGGEAATLNDRLSARAFTTGRDIFMARGAATSGTEGTRLLAHELTHVVQQVPGIARRSAGGGATTSTTINRAPGAGAKTSAFQYATESAHYASNRDEEHTKGKAALLAADAGNAISTKLYGKHRSVKDPTKTKVVTSFKTSSGGFLVVVTYANTSNGSLTYDTAYLSKTVAAGGEASATYYQPDTPVISTK